MENLSPEEQQALQAELSTGESLVWSGRPNPRVIFHPSDWYMVPFSLLWGGFAIFWEGGVTGFFTDTHNAPSFFMLWGIPFVIMGQYFIWGRFFYAAWKKKRILYAVTTRRILVLVRPPLTKLVSAFIESLPAIEKEVRQDGVGTLKFGPTGSPFSSNRNNNHSMDGLYLNAGVPVFVDIEDASNVYSLVADLRASHATRRS